MDYRLISATPNGDGTQIALLVSVSDGKATLQDGGTIGPAPEGQTTEEYVAAMAAGIAADLTAQLAAPAEKPPVMPSPIDVSKITIDPQAVAQVLADRAAAADPDPSQEPNP